MRIVIVGAGGFAREVSWLIDEISQRSAERSWQSIGYVVSDPSHLSETDSPVLGGTDWLAAHRERFDGLAIGIGNPAVRLRLGEELAGYEFPALVDPAVRHGANVNVGRGAIVCAGVIATVNVTIEEFALVNLSCTIGHEATIGAGSVLNPTVNVSGGVKIGRGCLIGTGAQILQYVEVGDGAIVGAGAVVRKNVPPGVTVVGVPAEEKPSRRGTP